MNSLIKDILKSAQVGSQYFDTRIHGGGRSVFSEYVRHNVSVWVNFSGETIEYQTGVGFLGNDFNCPDDALVACECDNSALDDIITGNYEGDEIKVGDNILTIEQAEEILREVEILAQNEYNSLISEYSDNPDEYYRVDEFSDTFAPKDKSKAYCFSNNSACWVEASQYEITDKRDGSKIIINAESVEDAAIRYGILITTHNDQYIDRDYEVVAV
jgi:hypothetical protein